AGHDRDPEVNRAPLVAHAEAAVLRHPALGDVELAHHLDAGQDGGVEFLGDGRQGRVQHAVNAVLDVDFGVAGLDVDVAGAALERGVNGRVHQLDDGVDVPVGGEALDRNGLVAGLLGMQDIEGEALGRLLEHALRLLILLEDLLDLPRRGHPHGDAAAQQQPDLIHHHQLSGIGAGTDRGPLVRGQRHEIIAEHQLDWHRSEQVGRDGMRLEIPQRAVVAAGQRLGAFEFRRRRRGDRGGAHDCILAPSEKMGKYSEIRINATTEPTTIKIAGSIRASSAVKALAKSSSKNSATEPSICGSAPVPSPASTISTANCGTTLCFLSPADMASPSCTACTVACRPLRSRGLRSAVAAVCSPCTTGSPPCSSVESVRQSIATWYFQYRSPSSGSRSAAPSSAPAMRPRRTRNAKAAISPAKPVPQYRA